MNKSRVAGLSLASMVLLTGMLAVGAAHSAQGRQGDGPSAIKDPEPPITDEKLSVHTLLREDIFAGFLENDMKRFVRGEKNIDRLMEMRPGEKANLLAWKGGALLYRAVLAHEAKRAGEFQKLYAESCDIFEKAAAFKTGNNGVHAITGGSLGTFADRLPEPARADAWTRSYDAYQKLLKTQSTIVSVLPMHHRGELLGGFATAAARTGHAEESTKAVDRILAEMRDTPYADAAKRWKEQPASRLGSGIMCLSCHDSGRLKATLASAKP